MDAYETYDCDNLLLSHPKKRKTHRFPAKPWQASLTEFHRKKSNTHTNASRCPSHSSVVHRVTTLSSTIIFTHSHYHQTDKDLQRALMQKVGVGVQAALLHLQAAL